MRHNLNITSPSDASKPGSESQSIRRSFGKATWTFLIQLEDQGPTGVVR